MVKKRFILLVLEILDQKQREQDKTIPESMKSGTLCNYKNRNYLIKDILLQNPAAQGQNLTK